MHHRLVVLSVGISGLLMSPAVLSSATLRPGPRTTYVLAAIVDVCMKTHPDLKDRGLVAFANSIAPYLDQARDYVRTHPDAAFDAQFEQPNLGVSSEQLNNVCPKIASAGAPMRRQGIVDWQFHPGYVENVW